MKKPGNQSQTRGWDTYWRETRDSDSYSSDGARHPVITAFWDQTLPNLFEASEQPKILDVATGSGAVVDSVFRHFRDAAPDVTCVDISDAAIDNVRERFPSVHGIVADARSIPLETSAFDLVTSQFGVEYAGPEGIQEAARLVAAGGRLILLLHCRPGAIYAECSVSLKVIDRLRQARFFPRAKALFKAGFNAIYNGDQIAYERAVHKFGPLIRLLDQAKLKFGEGVASGLVLRLRNDLHQITQGLQKYDPKEVFFWLDRLDREALSYRGRMKSMTDAAISQKQIDQISVSLADDGLSEIAVTALFDEAANTQLAWSLQARRDSTRSR